eukprot:UN34388
MYFSTGEGAKKVVTDNFLDEIIGRIKDKLRAQDWDGAMILAVEDITRVIEKGYVTDNTIMYILFFCIAVFVIYTFYSQMKKQQRFNEARRRLNEMEKAEAQELENKFDIDQCSICFEDFKPVGPERDEQTRLLRCGHRFCKECIGSWEEQGHYNCPLCRKNMYAGHDEPDDNQPQDPRPPSSRPGGDPSNNNNNESNNNDSNNISPDNSRPSNTSYSSSSSKTRSQYR